MKVFDAVDMIVGQEELAHCRDVEPTIGSALDCPVIQVKTIYIDICFHRLKHRSRLTCAGGFVPFRLRYSGEYAYIIANYGKPVNRVFVSLTDLSLLVSLLRQ